MYIYICYICYTVCIHQWYTYTQSYKVTWDIKSKRSLDLNNHDMTLIKDIIQYILEPLNKIFNLSIQTNTFSDNIKIAIIKPLYKTNELENCLLGFILGLYFSVNIQYSKILKNYSNYV